MNDNYKHSAITDIIIKAFYSVYNVVGYGFLEKVYENAIFIELESKGLSVKKQVAIEVMYLNKIVGFYFADIVVNDVIIVELKAAEVLIEAHAAQLLNYLRATNVEVGLLLNFGKTPQIKRKVFTNKK